MTAKVIVLAGYGLNCEEETLHAFNYNGIDGKIIHINDLAENPKALDEFKILAIPGGFSYGDDTGSGNAYAQKLRLSLADQIQKFVERDTLTIGICNGCQILSNLGLVPNGKVGDRKIAVTYNENNRYQCRWIDLEFNTNNNSPWLSGIERMHIPVAHGEGRFMMNDETLAHITNHNQIAASYIKPDRTPANGEFPFNPNGSINDIAAITSDNGKILAIMPHPERGMYTWQRDDYDYLKDQAQRTGSHLPETADGMALFANAAHYFGIKKREIAA
jgi:phosphoribosylformylglycinamidine synthase